MSNFIFNEVLSGVVDGVNKTFTSLNPIGTIEDLRVSNVDYTLFSYNPGSNIVVLQDAPTVSLGSPSIDYFVYESSPTPSGSSVTFLDIINNCYTEGKLGQDKTSLQFPIELTKYYINEGSGIINNLKTNPRKKLDSYSFNKAGDLYTTSYSATSINTSTLPSYVPSNGKLLLDFSEVVDYGSITTNSFTTLTGLEIVYEAGKKVSIGYKLPTKVKLVSEVIMNGKVLTFADRREFIIGQSGYKFTIIDGYLFLPFDDRLNLIVTVNFVSHNLAMVNDNDIIDIEEDYKDLLALYAVYNVCYDREDIRGERFEKRYLDKLRLYKAYLRQTRGIKNTIGSNIFRGI